MFERIKGISTRSETKTMLYREMSVEDSNSFLTSISTKDGRFGIEWVKTQYRSERHLFAPLFNSHSVSDSVIRIILPTNEEFSVYTAISTKSSCFPFKLDFSKNIMEMLDKYVKVKGEVLFCQLLFQNKESEWKIKYAQQYNDYLQGIDPHFVTSNKILRSAQSRLMEYVRSKGDWMTIDENPEITDVSKKLSEIGFKTCLRFVVYGSKEQSSRLANQIELVLREMDYANNWRLSKDIHCDSSLNQIILRKFPLMQREQILSLSEITPFFCHREGVVEQIQVASPSIVDDTPVRLSFKLPSISHLPKSKKTLSELNFIRHENQINSVLKRINIIKDAEKVKVIDVVEAATVRKITFQLPRGLNFSTFNDSVVKDIKSNMGKNTSIDMGREPNTVALTTPLEKRGKVYLRDLIETEEFKQFTKDNPLPMLTGIDENGKVIMVCISKLPHLLGAGTTGSGKSVWLNCVLLVLLLTKTPDEVGIFIIDPKMVEFTNYVDFPHIKKVETDPIKSVRILASLTEEMDRRYMMLAKAGSKNIKQYNAKSSSIMKYLVCIIDEYSDLKDMLAESDEDIEIYVRRLGQKARACGIHLIVATQRPDVQVINGNIKAVLPARIAFNCPSSIDYRTVLNVTPKFTLMGKGDGVCLGFDGIDGLMRFQGPMIADTEDETDDVIQRVLKEWKLIMKGETIKEDEFSETEVKRIPTNLERAKFLICEEGKVTVRSLAKALGIRNENTKEIFDELVADGWLNEPINNRSGYHMKVSAEEIEMFGIWYMETF